MFGVLQRKVKNSQSDCSLQDRLVMCEIKLKEPTDGSKTQDGGEAEEAVRSAAAKDLQHKQQGSSQRQTEPRTGQLNTETEQRCLAKPSTATFRVVATTSVSKMCWDFN